MVQSAASRAIISSAHTPHILAPKALVCLVWALTLATLWLTPAGGTQLQQHPRLCLAAAEQCQPG
jgi:hypothetical protein